MARTTVQTDFRVVIEPRRLGDFGSASVSDHAIVRDKQERQRRYRERCEQIAAEVQQRAVGIQNVGHVYVQSDSEHVCEHCGAAWSEAGADYNGGCCKADQDAQDAHDAAAVDAALSALGFPSTTITHGELA